MCIMQSSIQALKRALPGLQPCSFLPQQLIHSTSVCAKVESGKFLKEPLKTYEMSCKPDKLQHRKTWNSFNTSTLWEGLRASETAVEDMFIRKFLIGTFHGLIASEIIIKRQFNHIRICSLMTRNLPPRKYYFLVGYAEEMLGLWIQSPITIEIQIIGDYMQTIHKDERGRVKTAVRRDRAGDNLTISQRW